MSDSSLQSVRKVISDIEAAIRSKNANNAITAYNELRNILNTQKVSQQAWNLAHTKGIELHSIIMQMREEIIREQYSSNNQNSQITTSKTVEQQKPQTIATPPNSNREVYTLKIDNYEDKSASNDTNPTTTKKSSDSTTKTSKIPIKRILEIILTIAIIGAGIFLFMTVGHNSKNCYANEPFTCRDVSLKISSSSELAAQNFVILKLDQSKGLISNVEIARTSKNLKDCDNIYVDKKYMLNSNYQELKIVFECKNITLPEISGGLVLIYKLNGVDESTIIKFSNDNKLMDTINSEIQEVPIGGFNETSENITDNIENNPSTPKYLTNSSKSTNTSQNNTVNTDGYAFVGSSGGGGGGSSGGSSGGSIVIMDTVAPSVSISISNVTNPDGRMNITFTASASDSKTLNRIEIYLNSAIKMMCNFSGVKAGSCSYNRTYNISQTISYYAKAADDNENIATTSTYTVTIPDTLAPQASITDLTGRIFRTTPEILNGTAIDNIAISYVRFRLNNASWHNATIEYINSTTNITRWYANASIRNGTNYIEIQSIDNSSNPSTISNATFDATLRLEPDITIYSNILSSDWSDYSNTNLEYNTTNYSSSVNYSGSYSIYFNNYNNTNNTLKIKLSNNNTINNIGGYVNESFISFYANSSSNTSLIIRLIGEDNSNNGFNNLTFNISTNWIFINMSSSELNPQMLPIKGIEFIVQTLNDSEINNTNTSYEFYIDELQILGRLNDTMTPSIRVNNSINNTIYNITSNDFSTIILDGNASDDGYISSVRIRTNNGDWTYANLTSWSSQLNQTTTWSGTTTISVGINNIEIQSLDSMSRNSSSTWLNITLNKKILFGGIHMAHTNRSDGALTPDQRLAAFQSVFDWVSQTDHDYVTGWTELNQTEWTDAIAEANGNNTDNNFTYFFGFEWSPSQHIGCAIINPPATLINNTDPTFDTVSELAAWLVANNGVGQYNHPARSSSGTNFSNSENYNESVIPLVAMIGQSSGTYSYHWNYNFTCANESICTTYNNPKTDGLTDSTGTGWVKYALDQGLHLGFSAETDHHDGLPYTPQAMVGLANPTNWTREGVIDALRRRHTWAAENKTVMSLRINNGTQNFTMGDIFAYYSNTSIIALNYNITGAGTSNISIINLFFNGTIINSTTTNSNSISGVFNVNLTEDIETYIFIEAIQNNTQRAWMSPVWITYHNIQ